MKEKIKKNSIIGIIILLVIIGLFVYFLFSKNFGTEELKWETANAGLTTLSINTISENPTNRNILYAGTNTGIFKSIDGGKNWFTINNGLSNPLSNIKKIIYSPSLSEYGKEVLFALSEQDLFETLDGGNNWLLVGVYIKDITIKPSLPTSYGEKIYILTHDWGYSSISKDPLLFSISTGIKFFSEPKLESREEIFSFYKYLFSNQSEHIKVRQIDFLKEREITAGAEKFKLAERTIGVLTQNSWFVWLLTSDSIYFCWEDAENCEEQKVIFNEQEQKIRELNPNFSLSHYFGYSQSGIPHIYLYFNGNFLVKPCMYQGNTWVINKSLSKLGFRPLYTYIYAHYDYAGGYELGVCYQDEKETFLQDIIFTLAQEKQQNALLVSMNNGKEWKVFRDIPSVGINSIFVKYNENNDYSIFLATKEDGIIKTDIPFKSIKNK
jgi:hypothetical protein